MSLNESIEKLGGRDLFVEDILEYLQEAIDGGYSKTHSIAFGWHPKDGMIEMRGRKTQDVLLRVTKTNGLTRMALCRQRDQEDEGYLVQLFWFSPLLRQFNETRIYEMPLSDNTYLEFPGAL